MARTLVQKSADKNASAHADDGEVVSFVFLTIGGSFILICMLSLVSATITLMVGSLVGELDGIVGEQYGEVDLILEHGLVHDSCIRIPLLIKLPFRKTV